MCRIVAACRLQEHLASSPSSETPRIRIGDEFIQEDGPLASAAGWNFMYLPKSSSWQPIPMLPVGGGQGAGEGGFMRHVELSSCSNLMCHASTSIRGDDEKRDVFRSVIASSMTISRLQDLLHCWAVSVSIPVQLSATSCMKYNYILNTSLESRLVTSH